MKKGNNIVEHARSFLQNKGLTFESSSLFVTSISQTDQCLITGWVRTPLENQINLA